MLAVLFSALVFGAAVVLYARRPAAYAGFVLWIWFLAPLARRLLDYHGGYQAYSPVIVAPYLATAISVCGLWRYPIRHYVWGVRAFFWCGGALLYAFLVGLIAGHPGSALFALLSWGVPIAFGYHLAVTWHCEDECRQIFQQTFIYALLLLGAYAIVQWILVPPWDAYWMANADIRSIGVPQSYRIRVFGTMNSAEPMAYVLASGLFFLYSARSSHWAHAVLYSGAGMVGGVALLLTSVRSAWWCWLVGTCLFLALTSSASRYRIFTAITVGAVCCSLCMVVGPMREVVGNRLASLWSLSGDHSLHERVSFYTSSGTLMLQNPLGAGLGSTGLAAKLSAQAGSPARGVPIDSGIVELFGTLGWLGALPYLLGLGFFLYWAIVSRSLVVSDFSLMMRIIPLALLASILLINPLVGPTGVLFWSAVGLSLSNTQGVLQSPLKSKRLRPKPAYSV